MSKCVIFDFESLSVNPINGVAVSMALLEYDDTFEYDYEELLAETKYIKFDVEEQVKKYNRVIDTDTLAWWKKQDKEVQKSILPSEEDQSIENLFDFWVSNVDPYVKKSYTRGNNFDPIFLKTLCEAAGNTMPYNPFTLRDTRSMIEGMSWGHDLKNNFIPDGLLEKFMAHDPRHDIVMDVMRLQTLAQALK